jgi:hypothetical protein
MMLIVVPSHAHPGENALHTAPGSGKHVPVALHASAIENPQMPLPQSLSFVHAFVAPVSFFVPESLPVPESTSPIVWPPQAIMLNKKRIFFM